jgi:YesN/AraC family two-component response regulator
LQFDVEEAANGDEALRLINGIDNYDIVITDLRMPGRTNGIDVLTVQQQISPGTAGVLTTGFGNDDIQKQVHSLGVVYLEKPISLPELVSTISQVKPKAKKGPPCRRKN